MFQLSKGLINNQSGVGSGVSAVWTMSHCPQETSWEKQEKPTKKQQKQNKKTKTATNKYPTYYEIIHTYYLGYIAKKKEKYSQQ